MDRMFTSVPQPIFSRRISAPERTVKPMMTLIVPGVMWIIFESATSSTAQALVPMLPRIINAMAMPNIRKPAWMRRKSFGKVFQRMGLNIAADVTMSVKLSRRGFSIHPPQPEAIADPAQRETRDHVEDVVLSRKQGG